MLVVYVHSAVGLSVNKVNTLQIFFDLPSYFSLLNMVNPMYIQQLAGVILPSIQSLVRICQQITFLMFYQVSRLVTLLKSIYMSIQVLNIFVLSIYFKLINFVSDIPLLVSVGFFFFCVSSLYRISVFIWLGFGNHCNFACFL
jgi:hypothetical protein